MEKSLVNIDFAVFADIFRNHVRSKAIAAESTIVYVSNGQLIEEDPKSHKKTILKNTLNTTLR